MATLRLVLVAFVMAGCASDPHAKFSDWKVELDRVEGNKHYTRRCRTAFYDDVYHTECIDEYTQTDTVP